MENKQRPIAEPPMFPHMLEDHRWHASPTKNSRRKIPGKILGKILYGIVSPEPFFESKDEAKKYIEDRITQRRETFSKEYQKNFRGTALLTYEPALDREVYSELKKHRNIHEEGYKAALQGLNTYTKSQVETFIGERLNVGLSKWRYDLRPDHEGQGVLYGHQMKEPVLEMFSRGTDTRNTIGEDIDKPRQTAEITQFEKIQEVFGNQDTTIGTTIVSFSPPGKEGSAYGHNFYDVFILKEEPDKTGEVTGEKGKVYRYVEARRYASGLSIEQSLQKADELQPGYTATLKPDEEHVDAFLISNPIVIGGEHKFFDNPDALHKDIQGDPKALSYDDFQRNVVGDEIFSDMVHFYLQTLEERPEDAVVLNQTLNAIMNRADEATGLRTPMSFVRRNPYDEGPYPRPRLPIIAQIDHYGMQKVRQTATGCGSSGGFGQESSYSGYGANRMPSNMSQFKLSDASSGEDKYGKRSFDCPSCGYTNVRPVNELIPECQNPAECSNRKAVAC